MRGLQTEFENGDVCYQRKRLQEIRRKRLNNIVERTRQKILNNILTHDIIKVWLLEALVYIYMPVAICYCTETSG